ncbi:bh protein [Candidatus Aerophobetes bacterium]|uniref:Bh protein n=1 Tax=Aerophobetes bacterium TaxID=2030807 RepID=A0A497E5M7_UNCAE|nr:bh protein [Candidatus Aerophobetes bacterium]RLE10205.1 MAG: bh protein [Candidatus Aerophobetes bacterium]
MVKEVKTTLLCSWCFKEAPTIITYVGDSIVRIKCESCGHTFKVSSEMLCSYLISDWRKRAFTKPIRLAEEIRKNPSRFINSLPKRVVTKPFRMLKEIELIDL